MSAQEQKKENLGVVQNAFSEAAELAESISFNEGVSKLFSVLLL